MKWQPFVRWFSQIWLQTRYENKKKIRILLYSWLPTGTYDKNLKIWIFSLWNLVNLDKFSMINPLYKSKSYFSDQNLAKSWTPNRTLIQSIHYFATYARMQKWKKKHCQGPEMPWAKICWEHGENNRFGLWGLVRKVCLMDFSSLRKMVCLAN